MRKICILLLIVGMYASGYSQSAIMFQVDMKHAIKDRIFNPSQGDSLIVRSSFNEWKRNNVVLVDTDGDSIFSRLHAIEGDSGALIEYKYVIKRYNNQLLWEKKPNPENRPYFNRCLTLSDSTHRAELSYFNYDRYYLGLVGKDVVFSVAELQHDFNQMRKILEENHCCLYEYTDRVDMDRLFGNQFQLIDQPMTPNEFYKILTPITAKIGCMHTAVWMPGSYWDLNPHQLFPLKIKIIEDNIIVAGSYNDSLQIPVGSIISKINGRPTEDILSEMRENISADALNPYFVDSQIEKRFPLIYSRRFGFPDRYTISYSLPYKNNSLTNDLVAAELESVRNSVFSNWRHPKLIYELLNENVAYMKVKTFIYYDRVDYFKSFMDSCFQIIKDKRIENLILDLRGNDGGDPFCSVILFSYLEHEPVPYFLEKYGKYSDLADPIPLAKNNFKANLYTFLDGYCGSTNGHFSALLKYHKIGTFIGTPGGSTYKCNAGRDTERRLDHTDIILNFGRSTFSAAVEDMDKTSPIMPDYPVKITCHDFWDGNDICMETALKLINNKEK